MPEAPEFEYDAWRKDPTPEALSRVVNSLQPTMDYALQGVNGFQDPYLKSKARSIVGRAVQTFDPASASIKTWTTQQLMQLRRMRRQGQSPIKVPERMQLDNLALEKAEREFLDRWDREPDLEELADHTGISTKRIKDVRRTIKKIPAEAAFGEYGPNVDTDNMFIDEAVGYVYKDSDYIDRKIIEWTTGYNGKTALDPQEIAARLKLSPSQLSRRRMKVTYRIQGVERDLKSTNAT